MWLNILFVVVFTIVGTNSSSILVITSMPAHSHYTLAFRLAEELAERNHQVTFINPYPQKKPIKNLREIGLDESIEFVNEQKKYFFQYGSWGVIGSYFIDTLLSIGITERTFNNTDVQRLLNSKDEAFDVVIIEHFINEALVGIAHHFQAPVIFLAPVASSYRNNYIFGNPGPSSYVPDILGYYNKNMNFWQRLHNFLMLNFHDLVREFISLPNQRKLFKKYIQTDLELDDVLYNVSLILTTSHPTVNYAIPHLPNIIEIGGYHVSKPKKLPTDLQKFLDEATEGVVLFSMGSNLKSKDLTPEIRKSILNAFSKINSKVLWKFESDLPEAPKNVKIMSWLPQQEILNHPNVKCFITHGGLLSNIEAVYFGVPLIGIPIFGDQRSNIASAEDNGYALSVPLDELTEEKFLAALNEILHNPKYRENVKRRSQAMHDQPVKSNDLAVFWVEYVIRNKGADFLKSAGSDLRWYEREMIDIFAFLCLISLISLLFVYYITKTLFRKFFKKQEHVKKRVSLSKKIK